MSYWIKKILFVMLVFAFNAQANDKLDGIKVLFINGINNSENQAKVSAELTANALRLEKNDVKSIYNESYSMMKDIIETYSYAKYDGTNGEKDFTKLWKWIRLHSESRNIVRTNPPERFKNDFLNSIKKEFLKNNHDIRATCKFNLTRS